MISEKINNVCDNLISELEKKIGQNKFDFLLLGSAAMGEFVYGYSDIDIIVLTHSSLNEERAGRLLNLRQSLVEAKADGYYRLFEGVITGRDDFLANRDSTTVYWGTGGERIIDASGYKAFDILSILDFGKLLYGDDFRKDIVRPNDEQILNQVFETSKIIRKHGKINEGPHSIGWFFDVARSLYTLETGKITSKGQAMEWVIENGLFYDPHLLSTLLELRSDINLFGKEPYTLKWVVSLNPKLQEFADVLEDKLGVD